MIQERSPSKGLDASDRLAQGIYGDPRENVRLISAATERSEEPEPEPTDLERAEARPEEEKGPHSAEAERAVLAGLLAHKGAVTVDLPTGSFYDLTHGKVFAAMQSAVERTGALDSTILRDQLERDGSLDERVEAVLADIKTAEAPENIAHHEAIVRKHFGTRQLAGLASGLAQSDASTDPATVAAWAMNELLGVMRPLSERTTDGKEALEALYTSFEDGSFWESTKGLSFPASSLSARFSLRPSELTILAGRTSHYKTGLCAATAAHALMVENQPVLYVVTEMLARELLVRILSNLSGVTRSSIVEGSAYTSPEQRSRLDAAAGHLWHGPGLSILDLGNTDTLDVPRIAAKAVEMQKSGGLGLVVVDYIQQLESVGDHVNRESEVGSNSTALKRLALRLNVPVLAAAQLNREGAGKDRPKLSQLRESGRIEQDANNVVLLYYPHKDDASEPYYRLEADVAKCRDGETGRLVLDIDPARCRVGVEGALLGTRPAVETYHDGEGVDL